MNKGAIFEIGVGCAKEASFFIKNGYSYTGIDPAGAVIEIIQSKFPKAAFFKNNVYDFNFPNQTFDGFWCSAVLLHISKKNFDQALQKIKSVMKPDAIGFISLAQGKGEYFDQATKRYFFFMR